MTLSGREFRISSVVSSNRSATHGDAKQHGDAREEELPAIRRGLKRLLALSRLSSVGPRSEDTHAAAVPHQRRRRGDKHQRGKQHLKDEGRISEAERASRNSTAAACFKGFAIEPRIAHIYCSAMLRGVFFSLFSRRSRRRSLCSSV